MAKNNNDCRAIGKDLLGELKNGGFEEFVKFVKEHKELILCFRGNSNPEQVVIYYNNHQMWKLYKSGNKLKVSISFNHARYSENWHEQLKKLCTEYKFNKKEIEENEVVDIRELKASIPVNSKFDAKFVNDTFKIMKQFMDNYFDRPDLNYDYFQKKYVNKKSYIEKIKQQKIYLRYNNLDNGIFVYDLEFNPPKYGKNKNQTDMLGIEFKNKKPIKLLLIEVKCTKKAMTDKSSGLKKHITGMEDYLNTKENPEAINNRINEAREILKQYKDLELKNVTQEYNFDTLPIEIRVILTDEAVYYFNRNKKHFEGRKDEESNSLFKMLCTKGYEIQEDEQLKEIIITKTIL